MPSFDVQDSIAAIASPPGPAVRGVIRMSGPEIRSALQACFYGALPDESAKRASVTSGWIDVEEPLGRVSGDLFYWPGTASYTRQRSAEFHCSGSLPVLAEVMRTLGQFGIRQAAPGEFTMRAFLAGRIDLTRAEAVLGVIDSQSEREMEVALRQLAGGLSGPVSDLQDGLLEVLAEIEAGLDFVEDDIEFISQDAILQALGKSQTTIQMILQQIDQRQISQQIPQVVLWGRPNAGKSCLQNAFASNAKAIVSDVAGTTRDYLTATTTIDGMELQLIDTAGTLQSTDQKVSPIQMLAEDQTESVTAAADLTILCMDGSRNLDAWEQQQIDEMAGMEVPTLLVQTKSDLPQQWQHPVAISISSETGRGLEVLGKAIVGQLREARSTASNEMVASTAHRCFESLETAGQELQLARQYCQAGQGDEIVASVLRVVLDHLSAVTGKVFTDDILERVFSRFCIGK